MIKYIAVNDQYHLTDIKESDKPQFVLYLNDIEIFKNTLLIPYPYDETHADFFINNCFEKQVQHSQIVNWAIRNTEGMLIGGIGRLMKSDLGSHHKDEIGYWLAQPFRGQGIMTEVVKAFCNYLFENKGLIRIEAVVFPHNLASMKVLEKVGFERESYCRKYHLKQGKPIDGVMYVNIR